MKDFPASEGLSNLIKNQEKFKEDDRKTFLAKGDPIRETQEESIKMALKELPRRFKKLNPVETRTINLWEYHFNVRETQGLMEILEERGAKVKDNKDGTWTIAKPEK